MRNRHTNYPARQRFHVGDFVTIDDSPTVYTVYKVSRDPFDRRYPYLLRWSRTELGFWTRIAYPHQMRKLIDAPVTEPSSVSRARMLEQPWRQGVTA